MKEKNNLVLKCLNFASTATFMSVNPLATNMQFADLVVALQDNRLLLKSKWTEEEQQERAKHFQILEEKNATQTKHLMDETWNELIHREKMDIPDAFDEMLELMNTAFAKEIGHIEESENENEYGCNDYPIITPSQSEWLQNIFHSDEYHAALTRDSPIGEEPLTEDDMKSTIDSESVPHWLGLLPTSKGRAQPSKLIQQLLWHGETKPDIKNQAAGFQAALSKAIKERGYQMKPEERHIFRDNEKEAAAIEAAQSHFPEHEGPARGKSEEWDKAKEKEVKDAYEKLFEQTRGGTNPTRAWDDKGDRSKYEFRPKGYNNEMANQIAHELEEYARTNGKAQKRWDEAYEEMFNNEIETATEKLNALIDEGNNEDINATVERIKHLTDSKSQKINDLQYDELKDYFNTIQEQVNQHARVALQDKKIGTGGKKGNANNIITPTIKALATKLQIHCKNINAPDIMSEPMKELTMLDRFKRHDEIGDRTETGEASIEEKREKIYELDEPRSPTDNSYIHALGTELNDNTDVRNLHNAIINSTREGGYLDSLGYSIGFGEGHGSQFDNQQEGSTDLAQASDITGEDDGGDTLQNIETDENDDGGEDTLQQGQFAVRESDTHLGTAASLVGDDKSRERVMDHIRGGETPNKRAEEKLRSNWHLFREELENKVARGEMTQSELIRQLGTDWSNRNHTIEDLLGAEESVETKECNDPNHPMFGKDAETREKWGKQVQDILFGMANVVHTAQLRVGSLDADTHGWYGNDSHRPATRGDLKHLFSSSPIEGHGDDERIDDDEAREIEMEQMAKHIGEHSTLMNKIKKSGIPIQTYWDEAQRALLHRVKQKKNAAKDDEQLTTSSAWKDALYNIIASGSGRGLSGSEKDKKLKDLYEKKNELKRVIAIDRHMKQTTGESTSLDSNNNRLMDIENEIHGIVSASGHSGNIMSFANSIVSNVLYRNRLNEDDINYINKTKEQTHKLNNDWAGDDFSGLTQGKKPCVACVGSKQHFMNEDAKSASWNIHEQHKQKKGMRSPFVHMDIFLPDIQYLPMESNNRVSLENIAEYLDLPWDRMKHKSPNAVKNIIDTYIVQNKASLKDIGKHFDLPTKPRKLDPVGAASMTPANLILMSKLFPDEVNAFKAQHESNKIRLTQAKSISDAMEIHNRLQESGFNHGLNPNILGKLKHKDKMKMLGAIYNHSGGVALTDAKKDYKKTKDKLHKYQNKWDNFTFSDNNYKIWGKYVNAQKYLDKIKTIDNDKAKKQRVAVKITMNNLCNQLIINDSVKDLKFKGGRTKISDMDIFAVANKIYQGDKKLQEQVDESKKNWIEQQENYEDYDNYALGAYINMMGEINAHASKDYGKSKDSADQRFVERMLDIHFTEDNGSPTRDIFNAGGQKLKGNRTHSMSAWKENIGKESLIPYARGIRHGADNALGSVFGPESSLYSIPHIDNLQEVEEICKKMGIDDSEYTETEHELMSVDEFFSELVDGDNKEWIEQQAEDDDGLVSEIQRRRRNHSDMTVNEDTRDNENKLGTSTLCGYCRGHGCISLKRLANYYSNYHEDLQFMDEHDDEMRAYISQNARPADTPSFDHHRDEHGDDAYEDDEHMSYACPDCEHDDNTVRGGRVSDGLCNHCLGRGHIDLDDVDRMTVLMNERMKHRHHHGDHATMDDLTNIISHRPRKNDLGYDSSAFSTNPEETFPLEMFFERCKQGEFPNVLSRQELQQMEKNKIDEERKRGHRKALKTEWEESLQEPESEEESPMKDAVNTIPSYTLKKLQHGIHTTSLKRYMEFMLNNVSDDDAEQAEDLIELIMTHTSVPHYDHDGSFSLGGNSFAGSSLTAHGGMKNASMNNLFNRLQGLAIKNVKKDMGGIITAKNKNPLLSTISGIEAGEEANNVKNIFNKGYNLSHPLLIYHKGRLMTRHEIALYDGGKDPPPSSPSEIEKWFVRNANPKEVAKQRKAWGEKFGKLGASMGLTIAERMNEEDNSYAWESPEGKGINSPPQTPIGYVKDSITGEDKVGGSELKTGGVLGAFIRRGPTALKRYESHVKRAESFKKKIMKMKEEGAEPLQNRSVFLPHDKNHEDLLAKYGMASQNEDDDGVHFSNVQFHNDLNDYATDADTWLRPRMKDLDNPEGFEHNKPSEVPHHRKLSHDIETHIGNEFDKHLYLMGLEHLINKVNPLDETFMYETEDGAQSPLTAEIYQQISKPTEEGGDSKEKMKIDKRVKDLIKTAKDRRKASWDFGDNNVITKKDFFEARNNELIDKDENESGEFEYQNPIDWTAPSQIPEEQRNAWDGINHLVNGYFENYEKNPMHERDNELIKFAKLIYDTHHVPGAVMDKLLEGLNSQSEWEEKMKNDENFAETWNKSFALISAQHPLWQPAKKNITNHLDTLSHAESIKDTTSFITHPTSRVCETPMPSWAHPSSSLPNMENIEWRTPEQQQVVDYQQNMSDVWNQAEARQQQQQLPAPNPQS